MKDPFSKGLELTIKMIKWIAERTLSVKDYKEFVDEFTGKHSNQDELLDFLNKEDR